MFYGLTLTKHRGQRTDYSPSHMNDGQILWQKKKERSPWLLFDDCFTAGNSVVRILVAYDAHISYFHKAGSPELEGGKGTMRKETSPCCSTSLH